MLPMIAAWAAKSVLMQSPVGALFKRIPGKIWLYIAIAAALAGAFVWHQHRVHKALRQAEQKGYARAKAEIEAKALKLKRKMDTITVAIAVRERKRNDEDNRRINAGSDALRVRGPGRALCPGLAPAAGGLVAPDGTGNDSVAPMPDGQGVALIGLPFDDAVTAGREADLNRAEVLSWRRWYEALVKSWPKDGRTR